MGRVMDGDYGGGSAGAGGDNGGGGAGAGGDNGGGGDNSDDNTSPNPELLRSFW